VRLQFHALAYNLGNFLRTPATPEPIKDWDPEVASPGQKFQEILRLIAELRPTPPAPA